MKIPNNKLKVCRVATVPFALLSYSEHLELLQNSDCDITIVTSNDKNFPLLQKLNVRRVVNIDIFREINILKDLVSLYKLIVFFRKEKFDIIHSNTPKAGLLTAVAGLFVKSRVIHTFTGQRWQNLMGIKRDILIFCDKLISYLNFQNYCDSPSQKDFLISNGIGNRNNLICLGKGSFAGVNLSRFSISKYKSHESFILKELLIPEGSFIISFIGRLVEDKGISELVTAFKLLEDKIPNLVLLLIGPTEDLITEFDLDFVKYIQNHSRIILTGYTSEPEQFLSISQVFCLPSYREGFGTVIIEAAAMGIPSIGTNIIGLKDSISDNKTGLLVPVNDPLSLSSAVLKLYNDKDLRISLGINAFNQANKYYSHFNLTKEYLTQYLSIAKFI